MYNKVLNDLAEAIRVLKKEGYALSVALSDDFSEDIKKELSEFSADGNIEKGSVKTSVFYDGKEIAGIFLSLKKDGAAALVTPLKYVIEKLYEESSRAIPENSDHDIYRKAIVFIKKHYTENITVADVAAHIGYSESYFGYAFKKKYKMSVGQYVRELQLAKAKELLINTTFSVSIVASYVGFDDSNYFSALFKKYFGASPKEYRNLHVNPV